METRYKAFKQQIEFFKSKHRIRGMFSGKRGGKTEAGAMECVKFAESQIGFKNDGDPYLGAICAPTLDMLTNTTLPKFNKFADHIIDVDEQYHRTKKIYTWHNGSLIQGIGADKPKRIEGKKLYWAWIDEAQQVSEKFLLEVIARLSDTKGHLWISASLGIDFNYPKGHWLYKYLVNPDTKFPNAHSIQWDTIDNPHFPKDELAMLKETLDQKTFNQMYRIKWDLSGKDAVYHELDDINLRQHQYDDKLETSICIDWGWTHDMACGFFQFNRMTGEVFLFDEIVQSKMKLNELWAKIQAKGYNIHHWYCDAAGKQTREQSGISNIDYFRQNYGIRFNYRNTAITYGIPIVRSFIRNGMGQAKFFIDPKCRKSWDQTKNYRYAEKSGIMTEEPLKELDDCPDMIRYYFVNRHDPRTSEKTFEKIDRWGAKAWVS